MLLPTGRVVLSRGTRYRLEDGPAGLSAERVLQDDLEVEVMALGGPFDVFERDEGEWVYVRATDLAGLE
jgi:hypothetical protein